MPSMRVVVIGDKEKPVRTAVEILREYGVEAEPMPVLPAEGLPPGLRNGSAVLVVPVEDDRNTVITRLRAMKAGGGSPSVIAFLRAGARVDLMPLVASGIIDQIAYEDRPAALYTAVRSEVDKVVLKHNLEAQKKKIRLLMEEVSAESRKFAELEQAFEGTIENFMTALDLRDVETYGHSKTVARYCRVLAECFGIKDGTTLDNIRKGALLHDTGKIAIPDAILNKPGPLTAKEWEVVRKHPVLGYGLIKDVNLVKEVGNIILCHHERFDGAGYPQGLKNGEIPVEARIFALADTLDAITSPRPYRPQRNFETAKKEILRNSGGQFDPDVVQAFLKLGLDVWEKIRYETTRLLPEFANIESVRNRK